MCYEWKMLGQHCSGLMAVKNYLEVCTLFKPQTVSEALFLLPLDLCPLHLWK